MSQDNFFLIKGVWSREKIVHFVCLTVFITYLFLYLQGLKGYVGLQGPQGEQVSVQSLVHYTLQMNNWG